MWENASDDGVGRDSGDGSTATEAKPVILDYRRTVRDSVQGDIRLLEEEVRLIIDTPQFQRLRHVRQLGMVYLVYPGAQHSRFEHSLGTVQEAQRIIEAVNANPNGQVRLTEGQVRLTRLCALLHDISHIPFGHSIEDELGVLEPHDAGGRVIRQALKPLKPMIDAYGARPHCGWDFDTLVRCLAGEGKGIEQAIQEIVADTMSADLRDYIKRDFHYTGIPFRMDDRILWYFYISKNDKGEYHLTIELDKQGAVRRDNVSEILYLLRLRYFLGERVYYHPTKIVASTMVARAVQEMFPRNGRGRLLDVKGPLRGFGDDELVRRLIVSRKPVARRLGTALRDRRLYRPCWAWLDIRGDLRDEVIKCFADPKARRNWENETARMLGGEDGQVLVYCPPKGMSFKEADVYVHTGYSVVRFRDCPEEFGVQSAIRSLATDHENLWCFYVFIDPALVKAKGLKYDQLEQDIHKELEAQLKLEAKGIPLPTQLPQYKKTRLNDLNTLEGQGTLQMGSLCE